MKDLAGGPSEPEGLADLLAAAGLGSVGRAACGAVWQPLPGGRVNRVWRVETEAGSIAVKLYGPVTAGGLFPNLPEAEWAALEAGWRAGRAPEPLARATTGSGPVLIYRYLPAARPVTPQEAGRALAALHCTAPWAGLAPLARSRWRLPPGALARLGRAGLSAGGAGAVRRAVREAWRGPVAPAPLHGDPVPANMLATSSGPVLIDWQCPAFGDPATDLALFLSPGMQRRYGAGPLGAAARASLRGAYGGSPGLARYDRIAPALHARIALHCLAEADRGAAAVEIALLNRLARPERPAG